jgi:acetoacetate decarboxylase
MYRMPTHFGPRTGPRQGADGRRFENTDTPKKTEVSVSFLTRRDQLEELLPQRFELAGEPVVTVTASYITEIEWLAGRGYNTLGVSFPATFHGERDTATGSFLAVLWENLTDPIITGREELGFSKIYCELPDPIVLRGEWRLTASWLGFKFLDVSAQNLRQPSANEVAAAAEQRKSDGVLHFKYMPRTGEWGTADIAYATLTPSAAPNVVVKERWVGEGCVRFHRARWEDMPTQYNIVNAFEALAIREYRGASVTKTVGAKDLSDQRILE